MASSDYDSGVGGKFRKRPFRRSSTTTPYDRPQTAIRRTNPNPNPNSNGWISKIVDPASRIIYRGASKLFYSVFQKRLTAPSPQAQEENHISRDEASDAVHNSEKPSDEALEPSSNSGGNAANNYGTRETLQESPCTEGFFELEQLLKQKTFTRAEFDRLTDLLRSRTVEPRTSNLQIGNETEEEAVVTEQAKHNQEEQSMPQPAVTHERVENALNSEQGRMKSLNLRGNISNSAVNLHILKEEAVPPEEIAKAYMDSRSSKVSPTTLSVRSRLQDDFTLPTVSYAKKRSTALLDSRSSILFPGSSEHSENGYITPRPRGRSALYKMSRSPYFKVHAATNSRVGLPVRDGLALSSSSPSPKVLLSTGRQVLKRGSSVLDNDLGSFGPIRRTRQKSFLISSSQRDSSPSRTTTLRPGVGNGKSTYPFATIGHVPPQSTEMAMKIFQELGKLVPSPSEELPEKKGSGNSDAAGDSPLPTLRSFISPKQNIKENGPLQNAVAAGKSTCADGDVGISVTSATKVKSGGEMADIPISFSAATSEKEPAVQLTMAQESVGLDAKDNTGSASGVSIAKTNKLLEKPLASSSNSIPSSSVLKGKTDVESFDSPATEKGVSSAAFSSAFQPSSIPTRSPPVSEGSPSATPTAAVLEGLGSNRGSRTQKGVDVYKSLGSATSSGLSTNSVLFNSGASITPNQNNGFPISAISTSSTTTSSISSITATESPTTASPSIIPVNGIFRFSVSEQFSSESSSSAQNNFSTSNSISRGTVGFVVDAQPTRSGIGTTSSLQNSTVQSTPFASAPTFALNATSSLSSDFSSSFATTAAAAANLFSSSSQPPSSVFTCTFGSNPSLPSTGFSFGSPASGSTNLSSSVGASTGPVFSFSSISTTTSSASPLAPQPVFGIQQQTQSTGLGSGSLGNDHMNVEDCMTDDNDQAPAPSVPIFGQPSNSLSSSNFQFGAPAASLGGPSAFQFGNHHNSNVPQNPSPFQAAGNFVFSAGGSSSLGSTGGDKSGRRIIRVKRDKQRKK